MSGLLATLVGWFQREMANTLSPSRHQEGSRITTPTGTSYGDGMLTRVGGEFKVQCSANDEVEVLTARGEHHYSFTQDVRLLSSEGLSQPFASLPNEGQSVVVPTSPLLWIFSSPFLSWGVAVVGFVGLAVLKKMGHRPGLGS